MPSSLSISKVIAALNQRAPLGTAEGWDNVGLLLGDPNWETTGAVVAIDLSAEAIQLAVQNKFKLIVTHHPCIFPKSRGVSKITSGSLVFEALNQGIAVAAYHTNFDQCALEVVDLVSKGLGIVPQGRLIDTSEKTLLKLVAYVPLTHVEEVRLDLCKAGAGKIGNYDHCTFGVSGEGTFRGAKDTTPFIGKPGELERVQEVRLETVFPKGLKSEVLSALFRTHPYEEVAYDLYELEQSASGKGITSGVGYGFWGEFPSPKSFSDVAKDVKSLFNIHGFWITSPTPSHVARVGFVAGKGASFVEAAHSVKCDLLITGEVGYHNALSGSRHGLAVMELGHRESERFFIEVMKNWLSGLALRFVEAQMPTQKIWLGG
ncbi:MAG: Nif3-like dinuclear metal center hexameric protein, partial [Bdellovibrionia bacterium]